MYKLNRSFFVKIVVRIFASHNFDTFNKKWRQVVQEKRGEWWNLNFFSKEPFLGMYIRKLAHSLFGAWSYFLVHIRFTPSKEPKDFVCCCFFKKSYHGSWTMSQTMEEGHLPRSKFMVHSVNQPTTHVVKCIMQGM